MSNFFCSKTNPPLGAVITCGLAGIPIEWGNVSKFEVSNSLSLHQSHSISRHVARIHPHLELYPMDILKRTEVDHWLSIASGPLCCHSNVKDVLQQLQKSLSPSAFLAADVLTVADVEVFAGLYCNTEWRSSLTEKKADPHCMRWFNTVHNRVEPILKQIPEEVLNKLGSSDRTSTSHIDKGGKFVDLPGAEMGKVVVRFPPEASGYLHIGHAKAALLNQHYQKAFKGKLIMRFDDTNPAKEDEHFEKVILEDIKLLEIEPDRFTHTSDYFELMITKCEKLLSSGLAYVDDTEPETMKREREEKVESKNRGNPIAKNMQMWEDMKIGTGKGSVCCVRAKIDMNSANGCMRDPTIYRCKNETHIRTGNKFKVYPTYDFACPIVDSIEGVTHALRTTEYHDRDDQYEWFIKHLNLTPVYIYEYSRLNMNNTVLSKRKLTWFVNEGLVDGWDDPRFPTVRGIIRRGLTVKGLKDFIISQGSSRSVVNMEWDKIWAFNKKVIDQEAYRYTCLHGNLVPVHVEGAQEEARDVPRHPKDPSKGTKRIYTSNKIFIEEVDAIELKEGENATFINWGNLTIKKINKNNNGKIESINAEPNLSNTDFKETLKLTWLACSSKASWTPVLAMYFNHLITKSVLGKDEDFKAYIGNDTKHSLSMVGDTEMQKLKVGDIIQVTRKGFFRVDEAYEPFSAATCKEGQVILFAIPDGHSKTQMVPAANKKDTPLAKVKNQSTKRNQPEKIPAIDDKAKSMNEVGKVHLQIRGQGDKIRKMKSDKVDKNVIMTEVDVLKKLKGDFKQLTNVDWVPDIDITKFTASKSKSNDTEKEKSSPLDELMEKIIAEESILTSLKKEYAKLSGKSWNGVPAAKVIEHKVEVKEERKETKEATEISKNTAKEIHLQIVSQGDKIRAMKGSGAEKDLVKKEVETLLKLKNNFKNTTGIEWKPGMNVDSVGSEQKTGEQKQIEQFPQKPQEEKSAQVSVDINAVKKVVIHTKIKMQGDKVRALKTENADKIAIKEQVDVLLALKNEYKAVANSDWKPDTDIKKISEEIENVKYSDVLNNGVKTQGDNVRKLKEDKADTVVINYEVAVLLALKGEYKAQTGADWKPDTNVISNTAVKQEKAMSASPKPEVKRESAEVVHKKQTRLGLEAKKEENLSEWYSQVITKSEMIEYYNVSGCYILRPWAYGIWEEIKSFIDTEIKKLGVENAYFPIFVSKDALEREKTHIADFSPEVAWVTKSGSSDMAEPVAIRPTSETVMYPAYAKWIQSHRDLPIRLNQWNNVVRWEFKQPTPFLRTREFLWQEGHTAFGDREEAVKEVYHILELYAQVYENLLAIPVVRGKKTEKEKFAGGDFTITTEVYVSASGRGIQAATSHHLGQNFSKIFDITFEDPKTQQKEFVYQNSWGITTRTIGVMVMVHSDNKGLVLPPRIAAIQVVVMAVGITGKLSDDDKNMLAVHCSKLENELKSAGIKAYYDNRDNVSSGWKFNHWELKGVPIRLEVGPREVSSGQVFSVRRDTGEKQTLERKDITNQVLTLLEDIHCYLFTKARHDLESHKKSVFVWDDFVAELNDGNILLAPFCGEESCEDVIKQDSARVEEVEAGTPSMGAKGLCIPFEQPSDIHKHKCIHPKCSRSPNYYTLFGRSY